MYISSVSSQGQTTIPVKVRRSLGLTPNSPLTWHLIKDDTGLEYAKITSPSSKALRALKGVAGTYYKKYGSSENYLRRERASWDRKST